MSFAILILAAGIAAASEPVATAATAAMAPSEPPAGTHSLAEIVLPADALPDGCDLIESAHAISMQAETLGDLLRDMKIVAKPVATKAQSMRCGKEQGVVSYYQFATEADAVESFGFITHFVWGEDHPTTMHPELIDRWGNIVVVTSFRHPGPIEKKVMSRVTGGVSGDHSASEMPPAVRKEFEKGVAAFGKKDFAKAEISFRSVVASLPESALAHKLLGDSIFYQERFRDSIPEYEKARTLADVPGGLELLQRRILNDQLGMAYGLTGRLEDAKRHFETVIGKDPDYPMYYYNLACAEAELGDLDGTLANLKKAHERRANNLPGETLPNPREDDSFKKYVGNPRFEATAKEMGF